MAGPAEKKDYAFTGKKADAEEWTAKYEDGVQFPIVAPKAPTDSLHGHTVQEAADAASYMPKSARSVIKIVMLNPVTNPSDPDWAVTGVLVALPVLHPDPGPQRRASSRGS